MFAELHAELSSQIANCFHSFTLRCFQFMLLKFLMTMFIPIGFWFEVSLGLPIKSNTCLSLTIFAEVVPLYPV